jgi:hypothetical protein
MCRRNLKLSESQIRKSWAFEILSRISLKLVRIVLFVMFLSFRGLGTQAQQTKQTYLPFINGQVLNQEDDMPVAKALITNIRTKTTVSADILGRFSISALITDSLEISSLGFLKQRVAIPSIYSVTDILTIYARPISFLLPDVRIKGKYEKLGIKQEKQYVSPYLRNQIMKEKPMQEKAFDNQISFLKLSLGGTEKPNRALLKVMEDEKQWSRLSRIYNKEQVEKLTGLNNVEADNFMMYMNNKKLYSRMSTKENATYIILEQFKIYKSEGH